MRVALFCPFVHWPTHFATDLELADNHLAAGDTVTMLVCDGELPVCDVNLTHNEDWCRVCTSRRATGVNLLPRGLAVESLLRYLPPEPRQEIPRFVDLAALKAYRYDDFDLGTAVLSSVIFHLRDVEPDLNAHAEMVAGLARTARAVYDATDRYLEHHAVDRFYVFNPRFATTRGVMRACARRGVECIAHERGCDLRHYELYRNVFPHDRTQAERTIEELWNSTPDHERRAVGDQWYRDKVVGIETHEKSFIRGQTTDLLPKDWDPAKRNVVIFPSSEDEYVALGPEWDNPVYRNELEGVQRIVGSIANLPSDIHLYVRIHPNLQGVDNRQTRGLMALEHPRVTVIPADSPIATYAVLRNAWKIITFGSTVGVEAVYWGIPSILAGVAWYSHLGTHNVTTHEELIAKIVGDLPPRDRTVALKYGYFSARFGRPFRSYRPTSYDGGTFKGVDVWALR